VSKAQQPNTHTKDNKADQDKRIVPQTHVVIDPSLPTSASQPEPAKSDPQSPDKPLPRFERPEWVIVYITAAYSIVSLLTLFVIKRQTTLMAEQSKFAISKERARISVEIVTQPEEIDDPFWDIRF